jgi:hypothetical protein
MVMLFARALTLLHFARRQPRRRLLATVTAIVCLGILAAENDAEQVDSGWAISPTPPIAKGSKHADPKQQIILHDILHQSQSPLLRHPPAASNDSAKHKSAKNESDKKDSGKSGVRFAERPNGVEGWRPASQFIAPLNEKWNEPQLSTPHLNAPHAATEATEQTPEQAPETDCSGDTDATGERTQAPPLIFGEAVPDDAPETLEADSAATNDPTSTIDARAAETAAPDNSEVTPDNTEIAPESGDITPDNTKVTPDNSDTGPISEDSTIPPAKPEKTPPPPLTKQLTNLRTKVRSVLKGYYRKQLNSRDNDPWEVMHGMLAYGVHSKIRQGGARGNPVTSVGWLCYNKPCKNLNLLYVNPKGEVRAKYGVGLQGHLGQLLAMLAQCRVSEDYPIHVGKREFTIADLIESEKKTCYPKSELTFKLIALQYYLDLNDTWENDQGLEWSIPRLIKEELAQPIRGAACGGTHRLSSLSLTVNARVRRGEPLDGEYARAADFVERYHNYAFKLQNRDGSLSTNWFRGRGDDPDINRRIKTTGHILEWLCYSLSDEELREPKTVAAVTYLANLMYSKYDNEWEVGPMCHATHALLVYDERVFQPFDAANYNAAYKPTPRTATATRPVPPSSMRR